MLNRALMAKFNPEWAVDPSQPSTCACGEPVVEGETVLLYPIPELGEGIRDVVCLTCHFWFTHDVLSEALDD